MDESGKEKAVGDRAAKDARDWVVRLASGNMTDAELARFKAWREASHEHARAFSREREFWRQLDAVDPRADRLPAPPAQRRLGRRAVLTGAAAAASIAAVAAPKIELLLTADYRTAVGEQAEFSLPDGTRVTLDTDSALALRFRPGLRLVELLRGEALFDIVPGGDAPFRVAALDGGADAVDAAFSMRALGGAATVTVARGTALVFCPTAADAPPMSRLSALEIGEGRQTRYVRGRAPGPPVVVDIEQTLAWRSGRVIFDGRPFADALAELGRYVPEPIVLTNRSRAQDPVSAIVSIRQAGAAVAALARTQGLTARRIPGVMILVG
ncbi:FecR domain-containing protein [Methylosinus sp. C49]|uniref:FecR family protein n=1 Tax=Methylosinus sp. C49 TaxID=2699395 RepID=UPI00137A269E|nr:FecR domain-containing protein [Methylosinus sp. C49]